MRLNVENLSVSLGDTDIVHSISLKVEAGQFVGLIGPNGCGKSTLLKSIYKVIRPKEGVVMLDDLDVLRAKPRQVFRDMAVVGQFNELNFDFTVQEMVLMGRTPHKALLETDKREDYAIVEEALRRVNMADYAERGFGSLSGGEKQRVILARALAQQPSFLILDEPTNHLDIRYQLQILSIVKGLGVGALAALHDLPMAAEYCDYLYVMKNGRILEGGAPEQLLTKELLESVYEIRCEIYRNPITGKLGIAYLPS